MTIPIYPDIVTEQDLSPDHFGSEIDDLCQQIRDATKGWCVFNSIWSTAHESLSIDRSALSVRCTSHARILILTYN